MGTLCGRRKALFVMSAVPPTVHASATRHIPSGAIWSCDEVEGKRQ